MSDAVLSIVIPTRGTVRTLPLLLASLEAQKLDGDYTIFFVENLAGDLSQEQRALILRNSKSRILTAGRKGANAARNLGLAAAQGEFVLFLDDDCECPHAGYFQAVVDAHRETPEACAIGGVYLNPPGLNRVSRVYQALARYWLETSKTVTGDQLQLLGGCVSYKREMLLAQGLKFDPEIEFGGTETDLHERMYLQGLRLMMNPALSNIHHCDVGFISFMRKSFLQGVGHTQRALHRPKLSVPPVGGNLRPRGFLVTLYDLAFLSGKYWSSGQPGYQYPQGNQILTKILREAPGFFLKHWQLDRESWYWRWCRYSSAVQLKAASLYWVAYQYYCRTRAFLYWKPRRWAAWLHWKPRAVLARLRGQMIDWRWRLINFKNDLKFAWLGYGNHRVFERFEFKPLPPPKYFEPGELVRLTTEEFERLEESDLEDLIRHGRSVAVLLGDSALSETVREKFARFQSRLHGVIFSLGEQFDFRRLLPLWSAIQLPIFLETEAHPENIDAVYDHVKNIFYMGQSKEPKAIYSSCVQTPEPLAGPLEKIVRSRVSDAPPRFSFVIPIYNNADYISKVLDSIDNQGGPREDWEIVAVDDGSKECVVRIIEEWMKTKPPMNLTAIRWSRSLPNGGFDESFRAGRARNIGVKHARGEILAFVDSDILLAPDFTREMARLMAEHDVIQLTRQMVKSKPLQEISYAAIGGGDTYRESSYWEDFKRAPAWPELRNFWKYTCTYCLVMSRENYLRAGGFKAAFNCYGFEDVDVGYRLASLGRRFHLCKMPAYHLFPVLTDHSTHFDPKRRQRLLATSCRKFYLMNLDPEIYRDLYTVLNPPTSPVFAVMAWLGKWGRKVLAPVRGWPRPYTSPGN